MHIKRKLTRNWEKPAEVKNPSTFEILGLGASLSDSTSQLNQIYQQGTKGIFLPHSFCLPPKSSWTIHFWFWALTASSQDSLQHFEPAGHSLKCKQGCQDLWEGSWVHFCSISAAHPSLGHRLSLTNSESGFASLKRKRKEKAKRKGG